MPHAALLSQLRELTGLWTPGSCQFDQLDIISHTVLATGEERIEFTYWFDADGFSQYDKTISFSGTARRSADGLLLVVGLRVDQVGPIGSVWLPAGITPGGVLLGPPPDQCRTGPG